MMTLFKHYYGDVKLTTFGFLFPPVNFITILHDFTSVHPNVPVSFEEEMINVLGFRT